MKRIILSLMLVSSALIIAAQEEVKPLAPDPQNSISIDLLGNASVVAVSYERIFRISQNIFLAGRLGFGYGKELQLDYYDTIPAPSPVYIALPHNVTINLGKKHHFLEAGLGGTINI